ncbi:muramidase family protein [Agromyces indicus]|uniref:LysM peptidoglycan-binding domain-containing protein n=1 Tax=Agromyces indicus TaxID=758919 RepID=A0ABU1FQ90_9MICO|nr:LysM peptidoglycan-binding domain-containing protein [Agromyces indicus]MDR5693472.1 LysM peptidoglycan-binding domain-containing protein [Agromyces indicus]
MTQHPGTAPTGDDAHVPAIRPRTVRRLLTVPIALASAVAVTLGFAHPAEATSQTVKRSPKAKAQRSAPTAAPQVRTATDVPAEVTVGDGDTVSGIAARYGLSTAEVLAKNGLSWSSLIFPGQRLALPVGGPQRTAERPDIARHVVAPGDTIGRIAAEHGLAVDDVLRANGLNRASLIFPGQSIVLPRADAPDGGSSAAASTTVTHEVVAGDTPIGIAVSHGITLARLLELNDLDRDAVIHPGQRLVVRRAEPVEATAAASTDVPLDPDMRANARIIVEVGRRLGVPDRGIVIALAAAAQESGLRNLRHGDRDSMGLFQQRPSQGWGTPEEVLDPVRAARAFYGGPTSPTAGIAPGLLDVDGWSSMPVTEAAQAVQRSAHPHHYAKWEATARRWLDELG